MEIIETQLPGVFVVKPRVHEDPRGFFMETYRENVLAGAGIHEQFVQDNHSRSSRGVLRGLHYQLRNPQAKLCRVVQGEVLDVAVDIRLGSPALRASGSASCSRRRTMCSSTCPRDLRMASWCSSETADFLYKCSDYYNASDDRGVLWNDPAIGIDWQTPSPILSEKDQSYLPLSQIARDQLPRYQP